MLVFWFSNHVMDNFLKHFSSVVSLNDSIFIYFMYFKKIILFLFQEVQITLFYKLLTSYQVSGALLKRRTDQRREPELNFF